MDIDNGDKIEVFTRRHRVATRLLARWSDNVRSANWTSPLDARDSMTGVRPIGRRRLVFNVGGMDYRIVAVVDYGRQRLEIRFVGTHAEYNRINPLTV